MAFSESSQRGHENIIEGKIIGLNVTPNIVVLSAMQICQR